MMREKAHGLAQAAADRASWPMVIEWLDTMLGGGWFYRPATEQEAGRPFPPAPERLS
jgi:hypothetical protein